MTQSDAPLDGEGFLDPQRKLLIKLLTRITFFYIAVAAVAATLLHLVPGLLAVMPVGGIGDIGGDPFAFVERMAAGDDGLPAGSPWLTEAISLILAMLITLIAMIPVAWLYKPIHEGHEYDHSIDETALVMPAVVAGVVTVAQHSLALAFSLAGIVAGVRFRRALSDTFDTLFIFVAIGVGLAAGVGAIEIAIVIPVFLNYSTATALNRNMSPTRTCAASSARIPARSRARRKRATRRRKRSRTSAIMRRRKIIACLALAGPMQALTIMRRATSIRSAMQNDKCACFALLPLFMRRFF